MILKYFTIHKYVFLPSQKYSDLHVDLLCKCSEMCGSSFPFACISVVKVFTLEFYVKFKYIFLEQMINICKLLHISVNIILQNKNTGLLAGVVLSIVSSQQKGSWLKFWLGF